ncbi:MAG: hypothetical protein JXR73_02805 [Candidatus Omnitrophica bacterium]|nr:hypothetical protein [Candidatus Omnitrophota bacterium]
MHHRFAIPINCIFLRISIGALILLSLGMILYHPIEHCDGPDSHPDCPLCQMMNGQAPIPEFSSWLLLALFVLLFERLKPPERLEFVSSFYCISKSPRSPPF